MRLALPALGALAAEPLYVLADTAIVGHLGRPQIAALGLAGTVLSGAFTLFNFLTYGTTAVVARASGAGRGEEAAGLAAQALWVAVGFGGLLLVVGEAVAGPLLRALGGHGVSGHDALVYFRIGAVGLPAALVALAGQGYLRGVSDLRRPLEIVVAANVANLVLELVFVYGFHWGIAGSAAGTAIAQAGMGAAFAVDLLRPAGPKRPRIAAMRPMVRVGRQIFVRTAALYASFLAAASVLARVGDAPLGAHQIAIQLFFFLALLLDAIAIAGQVLVGRMLGAGAAGEARAAALRMIWWSVAVGAGFAVVLLATAHWLPRAFTSDPAVLHEAALVWPLFALLQPLGGAVFALDGILIGAGDTRYLMWSMLAASLLVFMPVAACSLAFGWGIVGVWVGLDALIAARLAFLAVRFAGGSWAVVGYG
jgi:putative MATE family efflux protein